MIALQLYTVRGETARDFIGTLRMLGEMGYRAVEFAGYGSTPVAELRAALDEHGLRAVSAHVPLDALESDPARALADARSLGCEHVVVPGVPGHRRSSADRVRELAATFDALGRRCRDEGFRFGYHNHAHEFEPLGDTTMWEIIAGGTDPALVNLQLDIFWARSAGQDPVTLIEQYRGRMPLLHVKDMADDAARSDAPVGEGALPWETYLAAGEAAGAEWYIVEQDHPRDALRDVRVSLQNLQGLLGTG